MVMCCYLVVVISSIITVVNVGGKMLYAVSIHVINSHSIHAQGACCFPF